MPKARLYLWIVIVGAGCLAAGACGLFKTRSPLKPPPGGSACRSLAGGPTGAVIPNTQDFYGRISGLTCYSSLLDTSFVFHPDPQDSSQVLPQTPYVGWNAVVEGDVNSKIANLQDFIEVRFPSEYTNPIISNDQETHFYDYQLRLSYKSAPDTVRYSGRADITFHRGTDGQWRITDWADHRGAVSDSTWGLLRADHRS